MTKKIKLKLIIKILGGINMLINYVEKRNGKVVEFQKDKIQKAVFKAGKSVNTKHPRLIAVDITKKVIDHLEVEYNDNDKENCPTVEEIQNLVETFLMKEGHYKIAKAYIIYREKHSKIRNTKNAFEDALTSMKGYLDQMDWRVNENSNMSYSLQGLNNFIVDEITSEHWLQNIYSDEIEKAHKSGDLHIHDLGLLSVYCVGWDLKDLLLQGFRGVPTKTESKPPKHLKTAFGQVVNFFYSLQGEAAGAQALSNFDTYLAPFIAYDNLNYEEVKQAMQEFIFNINVPTRVGFQSPFTNITMDLKVPKHMQNEFVIIGGEYQDRQFGEFQKEMDMLNKAFAEVMMAGDAKGRMFPFPIPTYSVTEDFDWDNETLDPVWEMTAKYGIPYWNNFINSDMDPEDTRSMCCRLNLDNKELRKRGGGLFGANPLTGSVGVVTLNLPRIAFQSENEKEFMERIYELMDIARDSLEVKRKVLEKLTNQGLYPYSKFYLRDIKKRLNQYWSNHFSTIGLVGMNEALLNLFGVTIADKEGNEFAEKVLNKMKERLLEYQKDTGNLYNLEATPAEGTSYSLAKKDRERFGNEIICANQERVVAGEGEPYYTNSTQLPVGLTDDVFEALDLQDNLQSSYTGGSSFHAFIGEKLDNIETTKKLVKRIAENYKLPYYSITPTFSICPVHGYIPGEHEYCPKCKAEVEAEEAQEEYNMEKELTSVNTSDLQPLDI